MKKTNNTNRKTSKKADNAALAAGAADIREAERKQLEEEVKPDVKPTAHKPSWRDFWKVHPACDAWPELPPDQRKALKADLEVNDVKVSIQTREAAGDDDTKYVIDGRTRLDLMEELGWEIVDKQGHWIGKMVGKAEHRIGCSPAQIVKDVISYNGNRRHIMSKQALVACIDRTLKAVQSSDCAKIARSVKHEEKKDFANIARSFSPTPGKRGGSTKDEHKAAVMEHASQAGISKRTVELTLAKGKPAPAAPAKPRKRKGKPKKEKSLKDRVWLLHSKLLKHFGLELEHEVKKILHEFVRDVCPASQGASSHE